MDGQAPVARLYHATQMGARTVEGIERRQFRLAASVFASEGNDPAADCDAFLESVYERTQSLHKPWQYECPPFIRPSRGSQRSTSVGDVIVVGGAGYFCAPMGWKPFELPAGGLALAERGKTHRLLPVTRRGHECGALAVPVDAAWADSLEQAARVVGAGMAQAAIALRDVIWVRSDVAQTTGSHWLHDDDVGRIDESLHRVSDLGTRVPARLHVGTSGRVWIEADLGDGQMCRADIERAVVEEMARRVLRLTTNIPEQREESLAWRQEAALRMLAESLSYASDAGLLGEDMALGIDASVAEQFVNAVAAARGGADAGPAPGAG